jgi:hypothetical protein
VTGILPGAAGRDRAGAGRPPRGYGAAAKRATASSIVAMSAYLA